jgi:hypothetical protein
MKLIKTRILKTGIKVEEYQAKNKTILIVKK